MVPERERDSSSEGEGLSIEEQEEMRSASGVELGEDIESLKQALAEEKARAEKYLGNWQRAQADLINYKKRVEQEQEEATRFANAALIRKLLPVLDDLERAFESLPPKLARLSWVNGIQLIHRKLQTTLEAEGLSPISAVGELFDPYLHEAVGYEEGEEGKVIAEVQKGYKLHQRVLRPALVLVGRGEEKKS
jgi:molecular chaperone GrpE